MQKQESALFIHQMPRVRQRISIRPELAALRHSIGESHWAEKFSLTFTHRFPQAACRVKKALRQTDLSINWRQDALNLIAEK